MSHESYQNSIIGGNYHQLNATLKKPVKSLERGMNNMVNREGGTG